jgi:hypothetical protein
VWLLVQPYRFEPHLLSAVLIIEAVLAYSFAEPPRGAMLALMKTGFDNLEGRNHMGELHLADINMPRAPYEKPSLKIDMELIYRGWLCPVVVRRP